MTKRTKKDIELYIQAMAQHLQDRSDTIREETLERIAKRDGILEHNSVSDLQLSERYSEMATLIGEILNFINGEDGDLTYYDAWVEYKKEKEDETTDKK